MTPRLMRVRLLCFGAGDWLTTTTSVSVLFRRATLDNVLRAGCENMFALYAVSALRTCQCSSGSIFSDAHVQL